MELCRAGHKPCHNGPVSHIVLDEGELVTVGKDGFIRVSFFFFALPLGVQICDQQIDVTFSLPELIYEDIFALQLLSEN